jgi:dolichol kinase
MRFVHTTGKTWYTVLYKHTMHVISLSSISITTTFKQITRIEWKCVQYSYNTLRETTFRAWRHVYLLPFIILLCERCSILCVLPLLPMMWRHDAWCHVIVPVDSPMSRYCVFSHIPMIWRHDKVVRQRTHRATSRHSFITTVWWYNILYHTPCIRQTTFFKFKGKLWW